jgi:hypothetical protein
MVDRSLQGCSFPEKETMFRHTLVSALTAASLLPVAASAQSTAPSSSSAPPAAKDDSGQELPQKIREKLTEDGFSDVTVKPSSFVVTAKDKDGRPVTMLIGPTGMTVISRPHAGPPSTAESRDGEPEIYQE